jgi:hypothetical protein
MGVTILKKDTGYGALLKRLTSVDSEVTIGVHEEEGSEVVDTTDYTIAEIAAINEFGGPNGDDPPERSWLRAWYDENQERNKKAVAKLMGAVAEGKLPSREIALRQFGEFAVAGIKARIKEGIDPENADSVIERKGSSTPLVDSGTFIGSITYRVDGHD